jgi:hypothetical protein
MYLTRIIVGVVVGLLIAGQGFAQFYPSEAQMPECPRAKDQPKPKETGKDPKSMTAEELEAAFEEMLSRMTPEYQQAHPPCRIHHEDKAGVREMPGNPAILTPPQ